MKLSTNISLLILVIFHFIGLLLFYFDPSSSNLSWLNLLITTALVFSAESKSSKTILGWLLIIFLGLFIEIIGVNTGLLFGEYSYGKSLGFKVFDVPLVIGFNWICIIVATSSLSEKLIKQNRVVNSIFAGILATLIDFLIEPVAIQFDMWSWRTGEIPLFNYFCWFLFSTLFSFIYFSLRKEKNKLGVPLAIIWTVFFITLQFLGS